MNRKHRIVSVYKIERKVVHLIHEKYPFGYDHEIKFYNLGVGRSFYAFDLITDDCNYLI